MADKKKILVVDDEVQMQEMIAQFLGNAGYEVSAASDGEMALATAEKIAPDLILMDIQMPKVDGWVVCHKLKANPKLKKVPIILFSGMIVADVIPDPVVEKCDYLMAKPIEMKNLLQKVKEFTEASR